MTAATSALLQNLAVAAIVGACALRATWVLLPAALRRGLASRALRLPLPAWLTGPLRRAAQPAGGCGCDGCDRAEPKAPAGGAQRITIHPRRR